MEESSQAKRMRRYRARKSLLKGKRRTRKEHLEKKDLLLLQQQGADRSKLADIRRRLNLEDASSADDEGTDIFQTYCIFCHVKYMRNLTL